jgi:glycosyltransferase involved in cell wall biosynthesis
VPSVLFIATLPPPITGQSVAGEAFLVDLQQRGIPVTAINLSKNTFRQGVSSLGRMRDVLGLIWQAWRVKEQHDCIYITTAESVAGNVKDLLLLLMLGRKQPQTWLHLHGGAGMRVLLSDRHPWLQRLNRALLRDVAGVIVLGERLAPIFDGYVTRERIHVVKNFAPDDLFVDDTELASKWAKTEVLQVLYLSNLLPGKGYEELVQAIRHLPARLAQRLHFSFAGGFESEAAKQVFLRSIDGLPGVSYHGTVHGVQKRALFRAAHLFCLPTYYPYEGQPISILEAYAAGCAVATTDHSGIFDVFEPGKNGWEVSPRSPASLVAMLEAVTANVGSAAAIGAANHVEAQACYRREHHLAALRNSLGLKVS